MSCEELRERISQDPTERDADFERHAAGCAPCRAYAARLRQTEQLIRSALRFDVARVRESAKSMPLRGSRSSATSLAAAFAAGVVVAVSLWVLLSGGPAPSPERLAREVALHWYNEPGSWLDTDATVASAVLAIALDGKAEIDRSRLGTVSYARLCFVAGRWIPHLVVQGEDGPFMVLLFPGARLEAPVPVELPEQGLRGRVVPVGTGSIAILGGRPEGVEQIERALPAAVAWTT